MYIVALGCGAWGVGVAVGDKLVLPIGIGGGVSVVVVLASFSVNG